jgi:large subunit ribosomal protein L22
MEATAVLKYAKFSAQKARLIANQIRGRSVGQALDILKFSLRRPAVDIRKALESAIANAENNKNADVDRLYVSTIYIDNGPMLKRVMTRAKGRASPILRRSCHITVKVSDQPTKEDK